jgi:hypothetical protein
LRTHAWLLAAIVAVLFATTDDRQVGLIPDGRQMIFTATAITETAGLGQARGRDLTVARPSGDSVSRYGMAMSLAQVPAAALAPYVEERMGAGASQPLFLIAPWLFVMVTSILAGVAARELGAGRKGQAVAILFSTLASPVGAYAALEFSEPLQALALVGAFSAALMALRTTERASWRRAALAGACASLAVLTKSSLLLVAPLALVPLLTAGRGRRWSLVAASAAGFLPISALWLYFEYSRFGRPLAAYAGESFSHSFWDGAWRLLVGVNEGIVFYFPAVVVAGIAVVRAARGATARRWVLMGAALPSIALLLMAAPWWAWHGVAGWGPRLLIPGVPLLAACAAVELERWRAFPVAVFIGLSIALNVPPLLQHPTPVMRYLWFCAWPTVDSFTAQGLPRLARREQDGRVAIPPDQVLATVPSASPFIVFPWFFDASRGGASTVARRLQSPPWIGARADIRPSPPLTAEEILAIAHPSRWNFWGRDFVPSPVDPLPFAVYDAGLEDQILRAQELRERDEAIRLVEKLMRLAPSGYADALLLESYRLLGRKGDAIEWLTKQTLERRRHPAINVVLALWDRDDGKDAEARALLRSSAASYPGTPVQAALTAPLSEWPSDFGTMTASEVIGVPLAR